MGRSPTWYKHVVPVPLLSINDERWDHLFETHTVSLPPMESASSLFYEPVVAIARTPFPSDLRFCVREILDLPIETGLIRSCSAYGFEQEVRPTIGLFYTIADAHQYRLPDGTLYNVFYVDHPDPDIQCAWMVRTDGLILNLESFQPLGAIVAE